MNLNEIHQEFSKATTEDVAKAFKQIVGIDISTNMAGALVRMIPACATPLIGDDVKLAWVAGLIEGEGSVFETTKPTASTLYPVYGMQVNMTDEDVIRKLHRMTGLGMVSGPRIPSNPNHKPVWTWRVCKRDHVLMLCALLKPHMGLRRTRKMDEVMASLEVSGQPRWRHGSRSGYEIHKCKCEKCTESNTLRHRIRRSKKKTPTPTP